MDALEAMRMAREVLAMKPESFRDYLVSHTEAIAALDAAIAQVEAAESTGLRLVPCEPNLGMQAAGCSAIYEASAGDLEATGMEVAEAYRAMLAAAPSATSGCWSCCRSPTPASALTSGRIRPTTCSPSRGLCLRRAGNETSPSHTGRRSARRS